MRLGDAYSSNKWSDMAVNAETVYKELKRINENVETLIVIYKKVVDSLIPEDSPTKEEIEAIESKEKLLSEEEFFKAVED